MATHALHQIADDQVHRGTDPTVHYCTLNDKDFCFYVLSSLYSMLLKHSTIQRGDNYDE